MKKNIDIKVHWRVDWKQSNKNSFPAYEKKELVVVASEFLTAECMDVVRQLPERVFRTLD